MDSILLKIRSMLGISDGDDGFDQEIMAAINTAIFSLSQIGVGPSGGFAITGNDETWTQLFDSVSNLEAVKSYIYLKVRLEFDPPSTSFLITSFEKSIAEIEWRLSIETDPVYVPEG